MGRRPTRHAKVSPKVRLAVYEASGWRCVSCGAGPGSRPDGYDGSYALVVGTRPRLTGNSAQRGQRANWWLEMDHIVAYANGGSHEPANRQTLCTVCNIRKGRS